MSNNVIKIMMDIDGVIAIFDDGYKRVLKDNFGINIDTGITREWDYKLAYPEITEEIDKKAWEIMCSERRFWLGLPQYAENIDQICAYSALFPVFYKTELLIHYITTRVPSTSDVSTIIQTKKWLEATGLVDVGSYNGIIVTRDKGKAVELLGITYAIDDKISNLEKISKSCKSYLLTRPWNVNYKNDFERVSNVKEFFENIIREEKLERVN